MSVDDNLTIGEIAQIFDGPHATPKKIESGPYFLSISSLEKGALDLSKSAHLSDDDFIKWTRRVTPQEGDVLFSYETRLGDAALMPPNIVACLGRRMGLLRPDRSKIIPEYLLYSYLSPAFQETIRANTIHGATVDRIALKEMPSFPIRVPPIDEQKSVVLILKSIDCKIETNRQINRTLEQIAQAIFKSWFVDFEPVKAKIAAREALIAEYQTRSGKAPSPQEIAEVEKQAAIAAIAVAGDVVSTEQLQTFAELFPNQLVESELGEIPEGWKVKAITEFGNVICGKTPSKKKEEYYGSDIPFIKIPDMHGGAYVTRFTEYLSEEGAQSQIKKKVPAGSVCISCIATVGKVLIAHRESHTNQQINSIVPFDEYLTEYLYFQMLNQNRLLHDLASGGSATLNLNTGNFSKIEILKPARKILIKYHQLVFSLFSKILQNSFENDTLEETRDMLLPKLLSGEIDLTNNQKEVVNG